MVAAEIFTLVPPDRGATVPAVMDPPREGRETSWTSAARLPRRLLVSEWFRRPIRTRRVCHPYRREPSELRLVCRGGCHSAYNLWLVDASSGGDERNCCILQTE